MRSARIRSVVGLWIGLSFAALSAVASEQATDVGRAAAAGKAFDAAPFAQAHYDAEAHAYALPWDEPRKIRPASMSSLERTRCCPPRTLFACSTGVERGLESPIQSRRKRAWPPPAGRPSTIGLTASGRTPTRTVEASGRRWTYRFAHGSEGVQGPRPAGRGLPENSEDPSAGRQVAAQAPPVLHHRRGLSPAQRARSCGASRPWPACGSWMARMAGGWKCTTVRCAPCGRSVRAA